jgi:hypothetical protein
VPEGLFAKLHGLFGFSWGQAAAATATLAVLATVTTLHFSNSARPAQLKVAESNYQVADRIAEKATATVPATIRSAPPATVRPPLSMKRSHKASAVTDVLASERTNNVDLATESEVEAGGNDYVWRGFDPEKGEIITIRNRDLIGAESSASTMPKPLSFVASI